MQTLTDMKHLLASRGLRPKHRLGQNFLHDHNQMRRILAAAEISAGDLVLEVGPGTGTLSEELLEAGAELVAVEIDRDLEPILRERLEPFGEQATLVVGDMLEKKRKLNPEVLDRLGGRPFKLVANLPYQIASPLLINLVADHPEMGLAVVMIQREVADRLAADPGGKQYGPLGIVVQAMCEVTVVSTLPPGCFWPPPKVSSAVVRLVRRAEPLTDDPHGLLELLHRLFSRRRKQIGSILGRDAPLPAGASHEQRPEQLSVARLCELAAMQRGG
ncbi:MAG: 16S rRNA (adenine(1518)-N(6)/adenine(1519)-N(6))-dimethyltransferase RsmA [Phycisphaeraceae bacterium]